MVSKAKPMSCDSDKQVNELSNKSVGGRITNVVKEAVLRERPLGNATRVNTEVFSQRGLELLYAPRECSVKNLWMSH